MTPQRKKTIGNNRITEYYWNGKFVVYVNQVKTSDDFETTCQKLSEQNS